MSGWIISVYRQQNYGTEPAISGTGVEAEKGVCLATWETAYGGLDWIKLLVQRKNAIELGGEVLLFEFTAKLRYLKRELLNGPPGMNKMYGYVKDVAAIEACDRDEWLLIQAWDKS